jgi:hypothetical protein
VLQLLVVALVLLPEVAFACPACLGQQSSWTTGLKLLGLMILVPYPIAMLVVRAIRNAQRELSEERE